MLRGMRALLRFKEEDLEQIANKNRLDLLLTLLGN
jgi:hypothetical protein